MWDHPGCVTSVLIAVLMYCPEVLATEIESDSLTKLVKDVKEPVSPVLLLATVFGNVLGLIGSYSAGSLWPLGMTGGATVIGKALMTYSETAYTFLI